MKKGQVKVGGRYTAKVSGSVVPVRITGEHWVNDEHRGWDAVNTETNRRVRIKSAQRLRAEIPDAAPGADGAKVAPEANPGPPDATGANVAPQRAARAYPPPADAAPVRAIRVIGAKPAPAPESPVVVAAGSPRPPKAKKGAKPRAAKAPKQAKPKRMSGLDACAKVLEGAGKPMGAKDMVEKAIERGLWKSGGKTPEATIYAAIIRDIAARGKESRFKKVDRGLFAFNGKGG